MIAAIRRWLIVQRCAWFGHLFFWPEGYMRQPILECVRCGKWVYPDEWRRP